MNVVANIQLFQDLGDYVYKYIYFSYVLCWHGVCVPHVGSACRARRGYQIL